MGDEDLVCICMTVTRGEIVAAIRSGCKTVDELKRKTLCCTGCGTCEGRVQAILDEIEGKRNSSGNPQKESA